MMNLLVRNVDDEIGAALKKRAASNHRSVEAEHREILRSALLMPAGRSFKEVLQQIPNVGEDADFDVRSGIGD